MRRKRMGENCVYGMIRTEAFKQAYAYRITGVAKARYILFQIFPSTIFAHNIPLIKLPIDTLNQLNEQNNTTRRGRGSSHALEISSQRAPLFLSMVVLGNPYRRCGRQLLSFFPAGILYCRAAGR